MRVREGMILVATDFSKNKNPRSMPWIEEIMKKKSFRIVIAYKLKPKVFLKVVEIFCLSFLIHFLSSHTVFIDDISFAVFFESGIRPHSPTVFVKVVSFTINVY